jgi:hypothetical protein
MKNAAFVRKLKRIGACNEAVDWVKEHGGTSEECWSDCVHGDWMAWLTVKDAKKLHVSKRQLVSALADCAALSLKYFEKKYPDDKRVRDCIKTCRKYAKGEATDEELENAYAAASAASAASAYAASASAYAAASAAAYAAYAAASAASAAAYAYAYAAASAASAAASAAAYAAYAVAHAYGIAREKTMKQCANIFRKHFQELLK